MKKILWVLVLLVVIALAWAGVFYWQNLRGAYVAIKDPTPDDVEEYVRENKGVFTVPKGYTMEVFAKGLDAPRDLAYDPRGVVVVSIPSLGQVVALPDSEGNGMADRTAVVARNLNRPHGLAFRCPSENQCELYVGETNQLSVLTYNPATMQATNKKKLLDLPTGGNHFTRSLLLTKEGGDDLLLISVGSSCNVCHEADDRRAKILFYNLKTGQSGEYARGLRNAVFMALHPKTNQIWVTEMGRDLLGDDIPPDEINIVEKDKNYGWPNCFGNNVHDGAFDKNTYIRNPCLAPFETPSFIDLPAHSAPLGLAFVPEKQWPREIQGDLLVAFHGSWNRTVPTGYKIMRLKLASDGTYEGMEDFITGWFVGGKKLGRPVDLLMREEGGMFISDDGAGIVYLLKPE